MTDREQQLTDMIKEIIETQNQLSFFQYGYRDGSASISEVMHAGDEAGKTLSKAFDLVNK